MPGYNVFIVSGDRESDPILNLICSVNEIANALNLRK